MSVLALDDPSATLQLKIKEAIHIQWGQPSINHQFYHVNLTFHVHVIAYIVCFYCLFCPMTFVIHFKFNFIEIRTEDDRRTVKTCF